MSLFERVDRVVISVPSVSETKSYLEDTFDLTFDEVFHEGAAELDVVFGGRFGIELVEPTSDQHPVSAMETRLLTELGPGVRVIVIKTSDIDAAIEHLRARGHEPYAQMQFGSAREAVYDFRQLLGVNIVLNQYVDQHPMTREGLAGGAH